MTANDYGAQLNLVGWVLCSVSVVVVGARCYCRLFLIRNFGLDDMFMVLALASGIAMAALVTAGVHYGYGLHLADITNANDQEKALMYTYLAPSISIVASTLGKISMVLFLVRLLGHSAKKRHVWFLSSVTVVMIGLNLFAIGILLGGCTPMQKAWVPTTPGTCIHPNMLEYGGRIQSSEKTSNDAFDMFADLRSSERYHGFDNSYIPGLHGLEAPDEKKHKMGTYIFDVWRAAAATFVKVYYMRDLTELSDVTYSWVPISIWAEVFVLNIAGSLPTLRPLYSQIRGHLPSSMGYARSRKNQGESSDRRPGIGQDTAGSEPSRKGPRAGNVTIDLVEIDNMNMNTKREAGLSTESILRTNNDEAHALSTPGRSSKNPSLDLEAQNEFGIQVRQDFSLGYGNCSERDTVAFDSSKRPQM
ncbi:hypothetical protein OPT61_g972 [Boeremia exigua]|uniref:Uncharacterized protein n=1 Tax=Boeremia exigua TaxID=749465 RepID=A0ACC2IRU5_9PLEO|nr:hypothetical protein OPT61_g972 [Boeremia exigua]